MEQMEQVNEEEEAAGDEGQRVLQDEPKDNL